MDRAPAVGAPVNYGRSQRPDAQSLPHLHNVRFIVEATHDVRRAGLLHQVALTPVAVAIAPAPRRRLANYAVYIFAK